MSDPIVWKKGSALGERDGHTLYSFTAQRGSWSAGVHAFDLAEAKRKLAAQARGER